MSRRRKDRPYDHERENVFDLGARREMLVRNWSRRIPEAGEDIRWSMLKRYDITDEMAGAIMQEWSR